MNAARNDCAFKHFNGEGMESRKKSRKANEGIKRYFLLDVQVRFVGTRKKRKNTGFFDGVEKVQLLVVLLLR